MATTTRGYPYPAATDAPNGATQIQALAQAVNDDVAAIASDTGWIDIPISSGFAAYDSTIKPQYRVEGGRKIFYRGAFGTTGIVTANANFDVVAAGGMPSTARPNKQMTAAGGAEVARSVPLFNLGTDGSIQLRTNATLAAIYYLPPGPVFTN